MAIVLLVESRTAAQEHRTGTPVRTPQTSDSDRPRRTTQVNLDQTLTRLALTHLPHHYIKDSDWGQHEKRWDGIEFRREGFRWETKRRWKMVPHGTWKKYRIELRDPENSFRLGVRNLRAGPDGTILLDLDCNADLQLEGRQSKWMKGVQLYSLSGEGHARVRLTVSLALKLELDFAGLPPDLVLRAEATDASLEIDEFRVDRISKVGGELTQQLGRQLHQLLREQIAERQKKLVEKINREIEEEQDNLRLSLSEAGQSPWLKEARPLLPLDVLDQLPSTPNRVPLSAPNRPDKTPRED